SSISILRIRVLAAATAKCIRSAPAVMLPASTTFRNSLRSMKSKRMRRLSATEDLASTVATLPDLQSELHSDPSMEGTPRQRCNFFERRRMAPRILVEQVRATEEQE